MLLSKFLGLSYRDLTIGSGERSVVAPSFYGRQAVADLVHNLDLTGSVQFKARELVNTQSFASVQQFEELMNSESAHSEWYILYNDVVCRTYLDFDEDFSVTIFDDKLSDSIARSVDTKNLFAAAVHEAENMRNMSTPDWALLKYTDFLDRALR